MPSEDIPKFTFSVFDFCRKAKSLLQQDQAQFVQFVLSGQYDEYVEATDPIDITLADDQGLILRRCQAVIDPILDALRDDEDITVSRDYDSILGIHDDIIVSSDLTVYPVAKREDTLTKNVHLKHHFTMPTVCLYLLPHAARLSPHFN